MHNCPVPYLKPFSDEVLQLIFYELIDPSPLTVVSKRLHRFSQDPYVRAHYFLTRYGPTEAMFYALGRGKVLTERVIDVRKCNPHHAYGAFYRSYLCMRSQILLASGAHLSRYLIQTSMHHYFYTQSHFIKTPWVRNVPLRVFTYFLKISEEIYGDIPRGKVCITIRSKSTWTNPYANRERMMDQFSLPSSRRVDYRWR